MSVGTSEAESTGTGAGVEFVDFGCEAVHVPDSCAVAWTRQFVVSAKPKVE